MSIENQLSDERAQQMTETGLWANRLLIDYLDEAVNYSAGSLAVVEHNSETDSITEISYGELKKRSDLIACNLINLGIESGDVIAVQLPNWWHYAALYLACVRIGAVINPLMPIFRERELEFMLGFSDAKILVIAQTFRGFDYPSMLDPLRKKLPHLQHVIVVNAIQSDSDFEQVLLAEPPQSAAQQQQLFASRRPDPNAVTELIYTSGTTGEPKGVMHSANTLLCKAALASELFGFEKRDRVFMGSPLAHQTGFMYGNVLSVFNGTACVMQDIWNPAAAAQIIESHACTITLASTPFLSDLIEDPTVDKFNIESLRLFLCAGAPIPRVLVSEAREKRPHLYVMSAWGMTEMGIATATYPGDPEQKVIDTDGRALPNQEVRVVDDNGAVLASGEEGRLQSRCVTTFLGYLKRPEAYGIDQEGWLETGDNARMDEDGYIRITGRSKDIIIRGGENIPVVEIEELLYRHPAVADAAIVAMPDPRLGERACAFVSVIRDEEFSFETMLDHLQQHNMSRQYLPERLEIIEGFPRTPSGKIQKFVLRERAQSFHPHADRT